MAKKIEKLRKGKGISQVYMADKLGITQSAYCKIEKSDKKINFQNIPTIASALGLGVMEIVGMD